MDASFFHTSCTIMEWYFSWVPTVLSSWGRWCSSQQTGQTNKNKVRIEPAILIAHMLFHILYNAEQFDCNILDWWWLIAKHLFHRWLTDWLTVLLILFLYIIMFHVSTVCFDPRRVQQHLLTTKSKYKNRKYLVRIELCIYMYMFIANISHTNCTTLGYRFQM